MTKDERITFTFMGTADEITPVFDYVNHYNCAEGPTLVPAATNDRGERLFVLSLAVTSLVGAKEISEAYPDLFTQAQATAQARYERLKREYRLSSSGAVQ